MKKCEKCGATGADDQMFCTNCGGNMVEIKEEATEEEPIAPADGMVGEETLVGSPDSIVESSNESIEIGKPAKPKMSVSKNTLMIIGMVVAVLIGIGGVVFGVVMSNSKSSSTQKPVSATTTVVTTTEVPVGKWIFTIPDGVEYEVSDVSSLVYGIEDEWMAVTTYNDTATYSRIKSNLQAYGQNLAEQLAMSVAESGTTEVGEEAEFTWIDFVDKANNEYCTIIFSEAGDMYSFVTMLANVDLSQNHDAFDSISEIVESAEKKASSKVFDSDGKKIVDFINKIKLDV